MDTVIDARPGEGTQAPRAGDGRKSGFRPDIQALRAVAVLAVVINHLWPEWLHGGYVGVDVFFVISGFLISSHLDREISRTGRVRLARFYARRIRRLLPAAFVVLGFSLVAAYFLLPYPRWEATAHEAFASALYWENWLLAANSVDYSAANEAASLVQHYWSLSVEEQFYLVWPVLLLVLFKVRHRHAQLIGIAVVGAASLAYSVYFTQVSPNEAYFITPVRVWEFALGALVALAGARLTLPRVAAGFASLAGFAMIIGSAIVYSHSTEFPGYLALVPTVGTALVIVSGTRPGRQWHSAVTSAAPVQFIGNISYSLYLWHWPLIMIAPFALSDLLDTGKLGTEHLLGVLAVSIVLAFLSKVVVEDRGMSWGPLTRSTKLTFSAMVAGLVLVTVAAFLLNTTYGRHVAQADLEAREAATSAHLDPCHGASAMVAANGCEDPLGPAKIPVMGPANQYWNTPPECEQIDKYPAAGKKTTSICDFSDGAKDPEVVWLVGDSHAQQWQGPLLELAQERGWLFKFTLLGGCPFAKIDFTGFRTVATAESNQACTDWTERMTEVVVADEPSTVFVSFYARQERADDGSGRSQTEQYRDGLDPYWRTWSEAGSRVVVLADPPLNAEVRERDCVTLNVDDPLACAVDRDRAQPPDPLVEAARTTEVPNVTLVDLTDYFCDESRCYAVVGNVAVYFDSDHLNLEFSRSLKPMLVDALE